MRLGDRYIVCQDLAEKRELLSMLQRRGYRWRAGQQPREYGWYDSGRLVIHVFHNKTIFQGTEINGDELTFREVKDGLTRNRQTQRASR